MNIFKHMGLLAVPALMGAVCAGCDSQIYDDLEPCRSNYHLKFRYTYNLKGEAFPNEVRSVAVWAFDSSGAPVWQHKEDGEALKADNYRVNVPLDPGKYDFITWCGLSDDSPFMLDTENPTSISDLGINLALSSITKAGTESISKTPFTGLYHCINKGVEITQDPTQESDNEIEMSLMKDTNYIKVLLQNLDGTVMKEDDFSFYITAGNSRLEFDNEYGASEEFTYHPWSVTSAEASIEGAKPEDGTVTSVSSVLAEFHTSRLIAGSKNILVVHRNSDDRDVIRIPLTEYLLLVKGNMRPMSDQEYLDRQDEYSITFFMDRNSNWYRSIGIYVNAWHVVPPQEEVLN